LDLPPRLEGVGFCRGTFCILPPSSQEECGEGLVTTPLRVRTLAFTRLLGSVEAHRWFPVGPMTRQAPGAEWCGAGAVLILKLFFSGMGVLRSRKRKAFDLFCKVGSLLHQQASGRHGYFKIFDRGGRSFPGLAYFLSSMPCHDFSPTRKRCLAEACQRQFLYAFSPAPTSI